MLSQRIEQTPALTTREKPQISRLANSIYLFIEFVFILKTGDNFRLIGIHGKKVFIDKIYPTLTGAKIAFSKLFNVRMIKGFKVFWTHFYSPYGFWLDEKLKIAEKAH